MAVAVGDGGGEVDVLLVERRLLVAPLEVLVGGEGIGVCLDAGLALGLQGRAGRAVEEAGGDVDPPGLARLDGGLLGARGGHRQALGREILDRERQRAGGVVDALDLQRRGPAAARRALGQHDVAGDHAVGRAAERIFGELHARRAAHHQRALAVLDHLGGLVAHHGHQVHGLARAVDAPVGVDVAVDHPAAGAAGRQARSLAPGRPLGRQVNRTAVEVEHGQVGLIAIGHQHLGMGGVVALQQRGGEAHAPRGVGVGGAQILAVLGHQGQAHAGHRLGGLQRAHHRVQAVGALVGDDRHVGEHHPAAIVGGGGVLVGGRVASSGHVLGLDHIAAGLQLLQHGAEREYGGDLLALAALHGDLALPDHAPLVVGGGVVVVAVLALGHRIGLGDLAAHQVAVGHAPHLDVQARDIDGVDADAVGLVAGQDHAVAREADVGRLVAEGEVDVGVGGQEVAALGGQALQQGDAVVGEAQPPDAQLVAARRDGGGALHLGGDQHIVAIGLGGIERLAHPHAGQRLGPGGVDAALPHRESGRLGRRGAAGVGRAGMSEEGPGEAGGLAGHARGRAVMTPETLGGQEAPAEAQQQRGGDRPRDHGLVAVHGVRPPRHEAAEGWKLKREGGSTALASGEEFHVAGQQVVIGADDLQPPVGQTFGQQGLAGAQAADHAADVLVHGGGHHILGAGLQGAVDGGRQRGEDPVHGLGKGRALRDDAHRRVHRPAPRMAQHHHQGRAQHADAVEDRAQGAVVHGVAGQAHDEQLAQVAVEDQLGRHAAVGATQHNGEGGLALGQAGQLLTSGARQAVALGEAVGALAQPLQRPAGRGRGVGAQDATDLFWAKHVGESVREPFPGRVGQEGLLRVGAGL